VNSNRAPAAKISGPASTLHCAHFGYLDVPRDRMYVADPCPPAGVDVFDSISTLNGAVAPSRRITGSNTTFAIGPLVGNDTMMAVALDSSRDILYVSTAKQDNTVAEVAVFVDASTATGNIAPTHIITTPPIAGRMLNFNHGVMLDSANDRLYVASIADNSILVFDSASTVDGQTTPTRWLSGPNTGLAGKSPLFVKFDSAGNLIVTCRTPGIPPSGGAIAVFAASNFVSGVTGNINVAPMPYHRGDGDDAAWSPHDRLRGRNGRAVRGQRLDRRCGGVLGVRNCHGKPGTEQDIGGTGHGIGYCRRRQRTSDSHWRAAGFDPIGASRSRGEASLTHFVPWQITIISQAPSPPPVLVRNHVGSCTTP